MSTSASNLGYAMRYDYDRPLRNYQAQCNSRHNYSLDRMRQNGEVTGLYGTVQFQTPPPIVSPLNLFPVNGNLGVLGSLGGMRHLNESHNLNGNYAGGMCCSDCVLSHKSCGMGKKKTKSKKGKK